MKISEEEMRYRLDNKLCIGCGKPLLDNKGICKECFENLPQEDRTLIRLLWFAFNLGDDKNESSND